MHDLITLDDHWSNFHSYWSTWGSEHAWTESPHLYKSGIAHPRLNALGGLTAGEVATGARNAKSLMGDLPFICDVGPMDDQEVIRELAVAGAQDLGTTPIMAADLKAGSRNAHPTAPITGSPASTGT